MEIDDDMGADPPSRRLRRAGDADAFQSRAKRIPYDVSADARDELIRQQTRNARLAQNNRNIKSVATTMNNDRHQLFVRNTELETTVSQQTTELSNVRQELDRMRDERDALLKQQQTDATVLAAKDQAIEQARSDARRAEGEAEAAGDNVRNLERRVEEANGQVFELQHQLDRTGKVAAGKSRGVWGRPRGVNIGVLVNTGALDSEPVLDVRDAPIPDSRTLPKPGGVFREMAEAFEVDADDVVAAMARLILTKKNDGFSQPVAGSEDEEEEEFKRCNAHRNYALKLTRNGILAVFGVAQYLEFSPRPSATAEQVEAYEQSVQHIDDLYDLPPPHDHTPAAEEADARDRKLLQQGKLTVSYLRSLMPAQLKRIRDAWSGFQPAFDPATNELESTKAAFARGLRGVERNRESSRITNAQRSLFDERVETATTILHVKKATNALDIAFWERAVDVLTELGHLGMSDDEKELGRATVHAKSVKTRKAKTLIWRNPQIAQMMIRIDAETAKLEVTPDARRPTPDADADARHPTFDVMSDDATDVWRRRLASLATSNAAISGVPLMSRGNPPSLESITILWISRVKREVAETPLPTPIMDETKEAWDGTDLGAVDPIHGTADASMALLARAALLTVAQVCGRWHTIAMTTPQLWSEIYFDDVLARASGDQVAQLVSTALARSRTCPLYVNIRNGDPHCAPFPTSESLRLLGKEAHRWRAATLCCTAADLRQLDLCGRLTAVHTLALVVRGFEDWAAGDTFDALQLRRLTWEGPPEFTGLPLEQLQQTRITSVVPEELGQLLPAFPRFKNSVEIGFDLEEEVDRDLSDPYETNAIDAVRSDLVSLTISTSTKEPDADFAAVAGHLLSKLILPALDSIEFNSDEYPESRPSIMTLFITKYSMVLE
ncbi:F-box domain-containing protein [Mycena kentingensis (nom. inval.)]|nr:F-box domain-containing protein [Mycena kentingensis (nom. inval.)]